LDRVSEFCLAEAVSLGSPKQNYGTIRRLSIRSTLDLLTELELFGLLKTLTRALASALLLEDAPLCERYDFSLTAF